MKGKGILRGVCRYRERPAALLQHYQPVIFHHASYSRLVPEVRSVFQASRYTPPGECNLPRCPAMICAIYNDHDPAFYEYPHPALSFVNSHSAVTLQHSTRTASAVATFRHPATVPSPATKDTLCLPTSAEDWKLADSFFQTTLVPEIMSLSSPEHMYCVRASTPTSPPHSVPRLPPSGE